MFDLSKSGVIQSALDFTDQKSITVGEVLKDNVTSEMRLTSPCCAYHQTTVRQDEPVNF